MYKRPPTNPFQNPPRNTTFPFQNNTLMFQQHQDESPYDAWTHFKNLIQRVPHHGLNLWSLAQFFYDHVDRYTKIDINYAASGNLRRLGAEEAWETIEDFKNEVVRVMIPNCMPWLDAYDEPIGDMEDKVDNPSPQRISMEVEPLDHKKLEDLGLNTCSHDLFLSFREVLNVDEPKPQSLSNFPSLNVNLGDKKGTDPLINTYSPGSFRMEEFLKKENVFFTDPGDGVRINPDGVARPAIGKFDFI
ncbi:hypothetical protein Tco_0374990 [Tanacetum coccineum]